MDLATVLVLAAMLILTAAFIARPLAAGEGRAVGESERRLSALAAQQDQILAFLSELDADFAMGKILPEDHQQQRSEWLTRGAGVLKEIDQLRAVPERSALETHLEEEVARLRAGLGGETASDLEARLEREVARRRGRLDATSAFCGHCGNALVEGDRFCPRCGTPVPESEASG
jgi:zinc-ribbon domain